MMIKKKYFFVKKIQFVDFAEEERIRHILVIFDNKRILKLKDVDSGEVFLY